MKNVVAKPTAIFSRKLGGVQAVETEQKKRNEGISVLVNSLIEAEKLIDPKVHSNVVPKSLAFQLNFLPKWEVPKIFGAAESNPFVRNFQRGVFNQQKGEVLSAITEFTLAIGCLDQKQERSCTRRSIDYSSPTTTVNSSHQEYKSSPLEIPPTFMLCQAYRYRGDCHLLVGDVKSALHDYSKAIDINPSMVSALILRGVCYAEHHQFYAAIIDHTCAITLCEKQICSTPVAAMLIPDAVHEANPSLKVKSTTGNNDAVLYQLPCYPTNKRPPVICDVGDDIDFIETPTSASDSDVFEQNECKERKHGKRPVLAPLSTRRDKDQCQSSSSSSSLTSEDSGKLSSGSEANGKSPVDWSYEATKRAYENARSKKTSPPSVEAEAEATTSDCVATQLCRQYRRASIASCEGFSPSPFTKIPRNYIVPMLNTALTNLNDPQTVQRQEHVAGDAQSATSISQYTFPVMPPVSTSTKPVQHATLDAPQVNKKLLEENRNKSEMRRNSICVPNIEAQKLRTSDFEGLSIDKDTEMKQLRELGYQFPPILQVLQDKAISNMSKGYLAFLLLAYFHRGNAYHAILKFDKAIEDYSRVLNIKEDGDAVTFFNRGNCNLFKGEVDKAIEDFTCAIKCNPRFAAAYCNRSSLYDQTGKYNECIADCSKVIEHVPDCIDAYYNRANAYRHLNLLDKAIGDYSRAIAINSQHEDALMNRGKTLYTKGDFQSAINDFSGVISVNPDDIEAYCNRGICLFNQRRYQEAERDLNKVVSMATNQCQEVHDVPVSELKTSSSNSNIASLASHLCTAKYHLAAVKSAQGNIKAAMELLYECGKLDTKEEEFFRKEIENIVQQFTVARKQHYRPR